MMTTRATKDMDIRRPLLEAMYDACPSARFQLTRRTRDAFYAAGWKQCEHGRLVKPDGSHECPECHGP